MGIYDRIDALLAQKKISRRRLALMINLPPSTLTSMFIKKSKPKYETLYKIAEALGVSMLDLAEDEEKEYLEEVDRQAEQDEAYMNHNRPIFHQYVDRLTDPDDFQAAFNVTERLVLNHEAMIRTIKVDKACKEDSP